MIKINKISTYIGYALLINTIASLLFFQFKRGDTLNIYYLSSVLVFYITSFSMLYAGKKLLSALPGKIPLNLFLIGFALVAGGAIVDMAATFICCPGLEREANVLILMLLSEKTPLNIIYSLTILMNLIEGATQLILFACFLKAYPILVQSIPYRNLLITLKWLLGLNKIQNWKQLFSITPPDFFFNITSFAFFWVIQSLYRFYMALMWFDKVPYSFTVVPFSILGSGILGLALFTHYQVKKKHDIELKLIDLSSTMK